MLLGFKKQFEPKILNGSKGFTLRNERKISPKIGEVLYMYYGLRTSDTKLITKEFKLTGVEEVNVKITIRDIGLDDNGKRCPRSVECNISINGIKLNGIQKNVFCVMDGFDSISDFVEYWTDGYKKHDINAVLKMFRWVNLPFKI